ncbi:MAG: TerC family protein [Opitutaceae bacterium]|jgi:tellurite resistance protein TerC|nr:TerC family protein [Opitutaceae bacterium]
MHTAAATAAHSVPAWAWAGFGVFVAAMLALDLGIFHKRNRTPAMGVSLAWCGVWGALALVFNLIVWQTLGGRCGLEFLAGYLVEISLSVDNIFVFIVVFLFFKVPARFQHRVLFWGIVGAAVMRLVFILAGARLLERFDWLVYVLGAFLVVTGVRMALPGSHDVDPSKNVAVRFFKKHFRVAENDDARGRFFIRENARLVATPLFLVLLVVESTDLAFAVDSIPAVLAITKDPFIVFTSNIFAVLGLRSIYFALNGAMRHLRYLNIGLSAILCFVGVKMMLPARWHPDIALSLAVIGGILAVTIAASLLNPAKADKPPPARGA